jgi:hypothetical protein
MTLPAENFQQNKYTVAREILDKDTCKTLSDHLINLTKDMTTGDTQCPSSPSIYGDPVFEKLLIDVKSKIENITGLQLLPTYSYARFYRTGDELSKHLDRKACEISASITLSYDSGLWPIWASESTDPTDNPKPFMLEVGDALIYRGMEINHWREKYTEGNWQCQVFLHYVDANGKYKDCNSEANEVLKEKHEDSSAEEFTGTMEISVVQEEQKEKNYDENFWYFGSKQSEKKEYIFKENILSDGIIDLIQEYGKSKTLEATIGYGGNIRVVDKKVRNAHITSIPAHDFEWLYKIIEKEIYKVNMDNFKFVLDMIETLTYIEYHGGVVEPGKYGKHTDGVIHKTRKLSFSILLSDPSEYEGGDLLICQTHHEEPMPRKKGSITFFPANVVHEVTPVTKGIRRSLVGWIHGPHFC